MVGFFFFFFLNENMDCCLRFKFRIFYNRLLAWIEFKFVKTLMYKINLLISYS